MMIIKTVKLWNILQAAVSHCFCAQDENNRVQEQIWGGPRHLGGRLPQVSDDVIVVFICQVQSSLVLLLPWWQWSKILYVQGQYIVGFQMWGLLKPSALWQWCHSSSSQKWKPPKNHPQRLQQVLLISFTRNMTFDQAPQWRSHNISGPGECQVYLISGPTCLIQDELTSLKMWIWIKTFPGWDLMYSSNKNLCFSGKAIKYDFEQSWIS